MASVNRLAEPLELHFQEISRHSLIREALLLIHGGWLALLLSRFPLGQTGRAEKDREEEQGSFAVGVEGGYIPVQDKPNAIWEVSDAALSTSKTIL